MNAVIIMGNIVRDPELRYLPKGTPVTTFTIAHNKKWKDESGAAKEKVSFFDVVAWSGRAETVAKYFHKGDPILVTGELTMDEWEDQQTNQRRTKVKINLTSFDFLPGRKRDSDGNEPPSERGTVPMGARARAQANAAAASDAQPPAEDDDVPF